jgi:hypothetical protein
VLVLYFEDPSTPLIEGRDPASGRDSVAGLREWRTPRDQITSLGQKVIQKSSTRQTS